MHILFKLYRSNNTPREEEEKTLWSDWRQSIKFANKMYSTCPILINTKIIKDIYIVANVKHVCPTFLLCSEFTKFFCGINKLKWSRTWPILNYPNKYSNFFGLIATTNIPPETRITTRLLLFMNNFSKIFWIYRYKIDPHLLEISSTAKEPLSLFLCHLKK